MLDSLPALLRSLAPAANALSVLADLRRRSRGDARALLEELKQNLRFCVLVTEEGASVDEALPLITTGEYDRLNGAGFDFNALQRRPIGRHRSLAGTDLASWQGKETAELVVSIYDKLKDIRAVYPRSSRRGPERWRVRVANIHKRILLLLKHVSNPQGE